MASKGARVPRLIEGVDLTTLPLSPLEGFVLSRVDGAASLAVLMDLTSLDEAQIDGIVLRLIELGAAEWACESVSLPGSSGRRATPRPAAAPHSARSGSGAAVEASGSVRRSVAFRASEPPPPSVHRAVQTIEERIDVSRRSIVEPRVSHTGALLPPGDVDEETTVLPPPARLPGAGLGGSPSVQASSPEPAPGSAEESRSPSVLPPGEELDLDEDRRRRIDELYFALDLLDHYQVLGVARDASKDEIRASYFQLSKVFHPDTMFRKRLGPYKARMEAVFKSLTEAFEVLGKSKARQEYDRYLALQERASATEEVLGSPAVSSRSAPPPPGAPASSRGLEADSGSPASATDPEPVPASTSSTRPMSEEAQARRRALMAKKLRAHPPATAPTGDGPPPPKPSRDEVLKSLASTLVATASHTGGVLGAQRSVLAAKRAEREGDLPTAIRELRLAVALAPERVELQQEHQRLVVALAESLAETYRERALYEQKHGKWSAAASSWSKVFEGRPQDHAAACSAAEALLEAKGDMHRAKALAEKAAALQPKSARPLCILARVYIAAGLPLNARRVLQQAVVLDPRDRMVDTLLRQLDR